MLGAGLAAGDEPVDARQVESFERPEQRLGRDEPHRGIDLAQIVGAVNEAAVLDRDPDPDVRVPVQHWRKLGQPLVALGQDLERMPVGLSHDLEDPLDIGVRNALVEEVAHRVDEDHPRTRPLQWLLQPLRPELELKALLVGVSRDAPPALGECLGVAVRAPGRDLVAARYRVPGRLSPLDRALVSHHRARSPPASRILLLSNICSLWQRTDNMTLAKWQPTSDPPSPSRRPPRRIIF